MNKSIDVMVEKLIFQRGRKVKRGKSDIQGLDVYEYISKDEGIRINQFRINSSIAFVFLNCDRENVYIAYRNDGRYKKLIFQKGDWRKKIRKLINRYDQIELNLE